MVTLCILNHNLLFKSDKQSYPWYAYHCNWLDIYGPAEDEIDVVYFNRNVIVL